MPAHLQSNNAVRRNSGTPSFAPNGKQGQRAKSMNPRHWLFLPNPPRKGKISLNARPVGVFEMGRFRSRPVFGVRN